MKNLILLSAMVVTSAAQATTIALWDFNGPSTTSIPGGTAAPTPALGAGVASTFGGITPSFASGTASGGSSDPVTTSPPNYAWGTTTYNSPLSAGIERGVRFDVSTAGQSNVIVGFDRRHSNTSSKWIKFEYTLDGVSFSSTGLAANGVLENTLGGDKWVNLSSFDLSSIAGANNNAMFGFRIGPVLSPTGATEASNPTSTYAAGGTLRYDMVKVEAVPEPATLAVLGMGLAALARRRRSK